MIGGNIDVRRASSKECPAAPLLGNRHALRRERGIDCGVERLKGTWRRGRVGVLIGSPSCREQCVMGIRQRCSPDLAVEEREPATRRDATSAVG